MRYAILCVLIFFFCACTNAATVVGWDNSSYDGVIVDEQDDYIQMKVKFGEADALMTFRRNEIAEIRHTPAVKQSFDDRVQTLMSEAEEAMKKRDLKTAAAAWAKLGIAYQTEPGNGAKARNAFDNAL